MNRRGSGSGSGSEIYEREGAAGEWRGSRAAVPIAPRVESRVAEGTTVEWRGRP